MDVAKAFRGATAYDIIAWHRPLASGIVLASLFSVWFTFVYFHYTQVTFTARIILLLFVAGAVASVSKRAFANSNDLTTNMDSLYEKLRPTVTKAIVCLADLFTWKDPATSVKAVIASLVFAFVGNWLSDSTLALLVMIGAFSIPAGYECKKTQIDAQLRKVLALLDKYMSKIKTKRDKAPKDAVESKIDELMQKNE